MIGFGDKFSTKFNANGSLDTISNSMYNFKRRPFYAALALLFYKQRAYHKICVYERHKFISKVKKVRTILKLEKFA